MDNRFWPLCDELVRSNAVEIDRPKGSRYPRWSFVYPMDYGFLRGTKSNDGAGVDIWRGSLEEAALTGVIVTVDTLKKDCEIKLLLGCTPDEAEKALQIHDDNSQAALLVPRNDRPDDSVS